MVGAIRNSRALYAALLVCLLSGFWIATRWTYSGYFQDDDLDFIGWTSIVGWDTFARGFVSLRVAHSTFRPTGHLLYRLIWELAGLDFRKWVLAVQFIHLVNCGLVFLLVRKWGARLSSALAVAVCFSLHPALFNAIWKPMYWFDSLATLFCLLTWILWLDGKWLWALASFWLAMKSKEFSVALPLVLLAGDLARNQRRWKSLAPFFAISLSFGVQALAANASLAQHYQIRLSPERIRQALLFYAPYLSPLVLIILIRERRALVGAFAALAFSAYLPLFSLELHSAYMYAPMAAVALVAGAAADKIPRWLLVAAVGCWITFCCLQMRPYRGAELAMCAENREFVQQVLERRGQFHGWKIAYYVQLPEHFHWWGAQAAFRLAGAPWDFRLEQSAPGNCPVVGWIPDARRVYINACAAPHAGP
jgi:hypothetical protein